MLTRRSFLVTPRTLALAVSRPLNFVVILVGDWGATDASCHGSEFYRPPNIDELAASGMRFPQAYSACTVCSRAALLTGKYTRIDA